MGTKELGTMADMQREADTALRQAVRELFVALDRKILTCDLPDSAFITSLRSALAVSRKAHGEGGLIWG